MSTKTNTTNTSELQEISPRASNENLHTLPILVHQEAGHDDLTKESRVPAHQTTSHTGREVTTPDLIV